MLVNHNPEWVQDRPGNCIQSNKKLSWSLIPQACVDPATKDELNVVEVEGQDSEGQKVKAVLATLKPSTMPSVSVSDRWSLERLRVLKLTDWNEFVFQVCLGGFEIGPPVVFRLRTGSGPVYISGQHLVSK